MNDSDHQDARDGASDGPSDAAHDDANDRAVDDIVARGPAGTFAVAGIATVLVIGLYLVFYVFAYLPRGAMR